MTRAWSQTRCARCGHEEKRYANVKRCRACHGPLTRVEPSDERDIEIARLRERLALAERIVQIARFWACHDAGLLGAIKEWETS